MTRKMKNSGIEWIGEIPEEWEVLPNKYLMKKLKLINKTYMGEEILSLTKKGVIVRDLSEGGKLPSSFDGYQILKKGNLLFCLFDYDVTPRTVGKIDKDGISSPAYSHYTMTSIAKRDYYYYFYLLLDFTKELLHLSKNLRSSFSEFEFGFIEAPVPSIDEQIKIANFLDKKTKQIEDVKNTINKEIENLENYKKSVITEAVTKGLDKNVEMKDSGIEWIGEIPKQWDDGKTLFFLKMPITDGPHTTPNLYDEGIPFVSAEAVASGNGKIDFNKIRGYISEEFYLECCKKYIPKKDDIYMIKSGATTGLSAMVDTDKKFTIWSPLAVFRADNLKIKPRLLFYILQSKYYLTQVELYWNYGTQQNIGMRTLEKLRMFVPPLNEQNQIVDYLDKKTKLIDDSIAIKQKQLETLEEYKKSLIYEYVTGKKEVKDGEES